MKATDAYRKINNSPLKGIILYYTEKISKAIGETNVGSVISKIQTGKTPPKATSKYYESKDVNWFKPSDIGYSKYLVDAEEQFSFIAVKEKKATIYSKETLLMIGIGGGVGRVSILKEDGSSNQQITGLTFKENIFPEYAYYYYLVREDYIKSLAKSMSFPILNQESIKGLKFSYPAIEEQKEFVRFIDNCWESFLANKFPNFDDYHIDIDLKEYSLKQFKSVSLIDRFNNNIKNETKLLTQLRQSILQDAIQGKLTKSWRSKNKEVEPASEILKRIKAEQDKAAKKSKKTTLPEIQEDDIPFELPDGWVWSLLDDISVINGGYAFKSSSYIEEGVRVIRISDFDENGFKNERIVRYEYSDELEPFLLNEKNILMAMTGGTVGKSLFVNSLPEEMVVNQRVATIKINEPILEAYINCVIPTRLIQDVVQEAKNSTNDNISMTDIRGFKIPIPPIEEQNEIVRKVELLINKCNQLSQEIETLDKHGKTLMKAMFNVTFETRTEKV